MKWNPDYKNKKKMVDHKERAQLAIKTFKKI
jgi:hypothetical protein